jgi:hypothetical protein
MGYPVISYESTGAVIDLGFPGGALFNAGHLEATYHTLPGEPTKEESLFAFAGTNLVFSHHLGMRTRRIDMWGDLRVSDVGLTAMHTTRDLMMFSAGTWTFVDDDGAIYLGCLLRSFQLSAKTRIQDRGLIKWTMGYRMMFEQLEP